MKLFLERWHPLPVALLIAAMWWYFACPFPKDGKEFLAAALSYSAILTGFLATAKAILMALPSESVMGRLRSSGYIDILVIYLAEGIYGCLAFCLVNLAGFFWDTAALPNLFELFWVFFCTLSTVLFVRVARIMLKILAHPGQTSE